MIPLTVYLALLIDLALKTIEAVIGSGQGILVPLPIAESGVLITAGVILHEAGNMLGNGVRRILRWRRRRR